MTVADTLAKPGPRKLLPLDDGGIRGLIALDVLARLERLLQEAHGAGDEFVLTDYFDDIGGTSTGAMLAAGLSFGMRVRRCANIIWRVAGGPSSLPANGGSFARATSTTG